MEKNKKSESILNELLFVKNSINNILDETNDEKKEIAEISLKKIDEIIIFFKGIKKLFFILIITVLVLFVLIGISLIYSNKAKNINAEIEEIRTDSIANQILEVRREMKPDSTFTTTYDYQTRNNKIVSYNQLVKENDSLDKLISKLNLKILMLEGKYDNSIQKIDMAKENYGINFKEFNKNNANYISIESKKIDSALILLEVYRNKLRYNSESKNWEVK